MGQAGPGRAVGRVARRWECGGPRMGCWGSGRDHRRDCRPVHFPRGVDVAGMAVRPQHQVSTRGGYGRALRVSASKVGAPTTGEESGRLDAVSDGGCRHGRRGSDPGIGFGWVHPAERVGCGAGVGGGRGCRPGFGPGGACGGSSVLRPGVVGGIAVSGARAGVVRKMCVRHRGCWDGLRHGSLRCARVWISGWSVSGSSVSETFLAFIRRL